MQGRTGFWGVAIPAGRRRPWVTALLVLLFLLGSSLAGCGLGGGTGRQEEGKEAVAVEVAAVERGDLVRQVEFAGQVRGYQEISVAAKVQGQVQVQEMRVDIGDRVRPGQVLARLDSADLEAQLRTYEAAVKAAESALALAKAGPSAAQLKMLQAQIAKAEANYENARATWERMQYLYQEGAISQQQWEQARTAHEAALADLEAARASLENAYPRPEQIRQLEAQVEQARAQADALRSQLRHYVVTSPIAGVITSRSVDPGSLVGPGVPLFTVVQLDPAVVEVVVGEREVNFLEAGREVEVSVPAAGDKPFTGRVAAVSPGLDARLGGYKVRVEIANAQGLLKPGMAARVRLSLEKLPGRFLVPLGALVDRGHGAVVFVVQEGRALERPVEVEATGEGRAALRSGVQEGEKVVVRGQEFLQANDPVRVVASSGGEKS